MLSENFKIKSIQLFSTKKKKKINSTIIIIIIIIILKLNGEKTQGWYWLNFKSWETKLTKLIVNGQIKLLSNNLGTKLAI